jgi:hypothetical protein
VTLCVNPVGDAHQAVALRSRPADSVTAHFEDEDAIVDRCPHRRPRRTGVFDDVGERLGDDEARHRGRREKHVKSIFQRLGLGPTTQKHRRVLAVLTFIRASRRE